MNRREIAVEFIKAFCSGRIDELKPLLHENLSFSGPLYDFSDRESYLQSLERDPSRAGSCNILRTVEEGESVFVLYEYRVGERSLKIAQYHAFSDGRISEIELVFDGSGFR